MVHAPRRSVPHHRLASAPTKPKRRVQENRRKINWPRRVLIVALLILALECVAVALLSPRFSLNRLEIRGLETISREQIKAEVFWNAGQNLFLAPTGQWERNVTRIPSVDHVSVQRVLPGTIRVVVEERKPWASVLTFDGAWHTIDRTHVPFRLTEEPEPGLPRLLVLDIQPWEVLPGVPLPSKGLPDTHLCVAWASAHPNFPVTQIEIDKFSQVYLSRVGKVSVQLGSGERLHEKLSTLECLIQTRPELTYDNNISYINIFAPDAPAIGIKKSTPQKKEKS